VIAWHFFAPISFDRVVVLGYKCSDHDCCDVARWTCFWPGQTRVKCNAHRDGWTKVAGVMGFDLASTPLLVREWPERDPSEVRFSLLELDR